MKLLSQTYPVPLGVIISVLAFTFCGFLAQRNRPSVPDTMPRVRLIAQIIKGDMRAVSESIRTLSISTLNDGLCVHDAVELASMVGESSPFTLSCGIGDTPLIVACRHGNLECVKQLLNKGVNVEVTNASNMTALNVAAQYRKTQLEVELLKHGASTRIRTF